MSPSGRDVTLIDFGSCSQISESGQPCIGSDLNFYSEYLRDDYTHFLNSFHHHVTEFLERVLQSPIHQDRLDYKRVADVQVTEFKDIMVEESTRLRSLPDQRKAATV